MRSLVCSMSDCGKRTEGTTGLCASHNKSARVKVKAPIKKVSEKLGNERDEYSIRRKAFLEKPENRRCMVYHFRKATTIHHSRGRGKYLLDESTWIPCSMEGHTRIELNPQWAREKGFTKSRLTE